MINLTDIDENSETIKTEEVNGTVENHETLIGDIELELEAYLGSAKLTVSELKKLENDSIIHLDANLNQTVALKLNGLTIAYGELVTVEDKFAMRITSLAK